MTGRRCVARGGEGVEQNTGRVVVLIDYDNFEICIRRDLGVPADLVPVVRYCQSLGTIVSARAYGSWDDPQLRMMVYRSGVEPAFAPVFPTTGTVSGSGKSVADTALVADGIDLLHLLRPETVVVVSSDKDLMPLVRMAKLRGSNVVVVGSDLTAAQLTAAADKVITYRELIGAPARGSQRHAPAFAPANPAPARRVVTRSAPVAPVAAIPEPVVVEPEAFAAAPAAGEDASGLPKRRRRRRGGRGRGEAGEGQTDSPVGGDDLDDIDTGAVEIETPAPAAIAAAPAISRPPLPQRRQPGRIATAAGEEPAAPSLPFRRPDAPPARHTSSLAARLPERGHSRREAAAVIEAPAVEVAEIEETYEAPSIEPVAVQAAAVEAPETEAPVEIKRPESAIGPIKVLSAPTRSSEPEDVKSHAPLEVGGEPQIVRPPLENLIGSIRRKTPETVSAVAESPKAAVAQATTEEAAPASDAASRRRRRRPAGKAAAEVEVPASLEEAEASPIASAPVQEAPVPAVKGIDSEDSADSPASTADAAQAAEAPISGIVSEESADAAVETPKPARRRRAPAKPKAE